MSAFVSEREQRLWTYLIGDFSRSVNGFGQTLEELLINDVLTGGGL